MFAGWNIFPAYWRLLSHNLWAAFLVTMALKRLYSYSVAAVTTHEEHFKLRETTFHPETPIGGLLVRLLLRAS